MPSVRIALADDQALVREGLKALLREFDVEVAVEAADGEALLAGLSATAVDVVVTDIRMPGTSGIDVLRALRARDDRTPLILLTTFDDDALLLEAVEAGAQGFLLKDAAPEDLHEAIVAVARGECLLQPVATGPVRRRLAAREDSQPRSRFSEREIAILRLMAGGYSNKEIARSVFLAEETVKNYVSDILEKLEARDRTRAVLKAITLRVI